MRKYITISGLSIIVILVAIMKYGWVDGVYNVIGIFLVFLISAIVLIVNIGVTADQNIDGGITNSKKADSFNHKNIIVERDSLDNKYITLLEMYGNYEVPNMGNPSQEKTLRNNYGLLGGVIEFPNSLYFVKAVGLNSAISSNKDNFKKFVYSIRLN